MSPQRLVIGPWSHVGMRGDSTFCHDVDFGPKSVWGVQRYFEEQLAFFSRWLPDDATAHPAGEPPVRIFVMGGGSGRKTAEGKLDHGGRWREEHEWPLARAVPTSFHLQPDGGLRDGAGSRPARSRGVTPSIRRTRCRRSAACTARSGSCRPRARGWSRPGRASSTRCSACATS